MKREQRLPHRLRDEPAHLEFAMELHLALGRMDVHVHGGGINFHEQAAHRIAALHQRRVIALEQGEVESAVIHGPAVHE